MKKIISLLSVFAMIATMFTTVAFADANNKFYIEETVDGTNVTLTFYLTTNKDLASATGTLDMTAAIAACDEIKAVPTGENIFNFNATQKVLSWTVSSVTGFTGLQEIGVLTLTNVKSDFSLPQKRAFTAKDTSKVAVVSAFTNEQVGYTVTAPATEVLPADRSEAVMFKANANTYVEIKKGEEVKNFFLPTKVDGEATVYGLFKYTVDGTNVAKNDVFTIKAIDTVTKEAADVATVTVK